MYAKYATGDSWAVVTGGSDGIGLEVCRQLAVEGFNICIIGRTESKIRNALQEIHALNPKIKTDCIVFDFGKHASIQDYQEKIAEPLKSKDIGMLVLNAGVGEPGLIASLEDQALTNQVNVNALQPVYTIKTLLDQIVKREKRSAIIVVSSSAARRPIAGMTLYCATKTFASFIARGLSFELKDKCDVLAWQPAAIKTKMTDAFKPDQEVGGALISVKTAVNDLFKQLGKEPVATGNWRHAAMLRMMS